MPEPMTAARIQAAAETLKVTYLPLLLNPDDDPYEAADLSEPLAALLGRQAAAVATLEGAGYDGDPLVVAELLALVEHVEAAAAVHG